VRGEVAASGGVVDTTEEEDDDCDDCEGEATLPLALTLMEGAIVDEVEVDAEEVEGAVGQLASAVALAVGLAEALAVALTFGAALE